MLTGLVSRVQSITFVNVQNEKDMNVKELRIGNLVISFDSVSEIDADCFDMIIDDFGTWEPIPLTEEWLVKFGFINSESDPIYFIKGSVAGNFYTPNYELDWIEQSPCDSVHKLQNLYFALTGEELTTQS